MDGPRQLDEKKMQISAILDCRIQLYPNFQGVKILTMTVTI